MMFFLIGALVAAVLLFWGTDVLSTSASRYVLLLLAILLASLVFLVVGRGRNGRDRGS